MSEEEEIEWELPGQEPEGIRWRVVIPAVVVTALVFGGSVAIEVAMARSSRRPEQYADIPAAIGQPQIDLVNQLPYELDVRGYRERDEQLESLRSWGWVDRARRVVHEPVDLAIDELVRRHRGRGGGEAP